MRSLSMRLPTVAALLAVMLFVPAAVDRSSLTSLFTQFALISLLAMSYNMLMGQTGMLSFGHAVYSGLGAYCTAHFLNHFGADGLGAGIVFLPLVGAVSGAFFGLTLGFVSTRRSGIAFAMITLGISRVDRAPGPDDAGLVRRPTRHHGRPHAEHAGIGLRPGFGPAGPITTCWDGRSWSSSCSS